VFEDEHELVIVAAMPGVIAERVRVVHESGVLVVRGERPLPFAGQRFAVRQLEFRMAPSSGGSRCRLAATKPVPRAHLRCLVLRLRRIG